VRKGQNPAKLGTPAHKPRPLGIAVLVHIPYPEGYFAESWRIFTYQLASLKAHTQEAYDLLVFDNGSCREIQARLQGLHENGSIQWLVLARDNLGKTGALNLIFGAMPNEWICYADSDVLFRPGWLDASRAIFRSFPKAGLVTAQPCFFDVLRGEGQAHKALENVAGFEFGEIGPPEGTAEEYSRGIGASEEEAENLEASRLTAVTNTETGVRAIVGASHMQFLAHCDTLRRILPLPSERGLDPAEDREMDLRIDRLGYLHLSTLKPFVFHMGNTIDHCLSEELAQLSIPSARQAAEVAAPVTDHGLLYRFLASLARSPRFRWRLAWLYRTLYEVFSRS
jgi:glycosyltransferase involved in cell wall biosynthesis